MHIHLGRIAAQRIHRQCRAKRAAANADVDQVFYLSHRAFVDRTHHQLHAMTQRLGFFHAGFQAHAAQGGMLGRAVFRWVDHFAGEQAAAHFAKIGSLRQLLEIGKEIIRQVCFRPVEQYPRLAQFQPCRKLGHPLWIFRKQLCQRGVGMEGKVLPGFVAGLRHWERFLSYRGILG